MLDQQDIEIVDDYLANEENDRLNAFIEPRLQDRLPRPLNDACVPWRHSHEIRHNQRRGHGTDHSCYAVTQGHQYNRSKQLDHDFQTKIDG